MYYNPNYRRYLEQYGFGDWLGRNAGTIGTVSGMVIGGAVGSVVPGAGTAMGASLGASLGGSVGNAAGQNYQQNESADAQSEQMKLQQQQQAYQNRVNTAAQGLTNNKLQDNQFAGMNRFAFGGGLEDPPTKETMHGGLSYNSFYPRKTIEGQNYYIIPKTTGSMNEPNIQQFSDAYLTTQDSTLVPKYGNIQGATYNNDRNKLFFNSDSSGDQSKFKNAFFGKLSAKDLGFDNGNIAGGEQVEYANGGNLSKSINPMAGLNKYTGQSHSGKDGGIAVDQNGSPTATTGNQPVGLVEAGEMAWKDPNSGQTYIFSKKLSYTK